jgi:hypothetical protein
MQSKLAIMNAILLTIPLVSVCKSRLNKLVNVVFTDVLNCLSKTGDYMIRDKADECILNLIENTVYINIIPSIAFEVRKNPKEFIRERCMVWTIITVYF